MWNKVKEFFNYKKSIFLDSSFVEMFACKIKHFTRPVKKTYKLLEK